MENKIVLPENLPAEAEVIGSCLRDTTLIAKCKLNPSDFCGALHREIFSVMQDLGKVVSVAAIHQAMRGSEAYENAGGEEWLKTMYVEAHPSAIKYNTGLILEDSRRRRLVEVGSELVQKVAEGDDSLSLMGELREALISMQKELDVDEVNMQNLLSDIVQRIQTGGDGDTGILTGFDAFDFGGGLETGLHSIHGASGLGKTALALNILINVLKRYPHGHVIHFSFEGSAKSLIKRILARQADVPFRALRRDQVDTDGKARVAHAASASFWKNLHIVEHTRYANIAKLIAYSATECLKRKVNLITVDHLQLMETSGNRFQNRHLEISKITRDLSFLAKDLDIPVVVFSQVNEDGQAKESRDIKAHSTNYFALSQATEPLTPRSPFVMKVKCEKGRDTGVWEKFLEFDGEHMSFTDCDKPEVVMDEKPKRSERGMR